MNFEHIMLDLETLSSKHDAMIVSIGAVRFDLETFEVGAGPTREFYEVIDTQDTELENYDLRIDVNTVRWWMIQSEEARKIFSEKGERLTTVLADFNRFVARVPNSCIWGNGATFDNVILRNAYGACGMTYPVSYKNDLCYRTIRRMWPIEWNNEFKGTRHNALDDARLQAETLVETMRRLCGNTEAEKSAR